MKVYDYDLQSGIACPENVITAGNVRLTLLSERLMRYEKSPSGKFTDQTTQGIFKRNFPPVKKTVKQSGNIITVKTDCVTFVINLENFEKGYVKFANGKTAKLDGKGNLGGTVRTLDTNDRHLIVDEKVSIENADRKHIKLCDGVISQTGVALWNDGASLILENDEVKPREPETDLYIFAFGHDYRAAVNALYEISGKVPLIPRFALGNWWSRYHAYEQDEYMNLMDEFAEREIPLSVATVDMDWHYVDVQNEFIKSSGLTDPELYGEQHGWTGYSWNKHLFYDYKKFLSDLKKRDLKVTLNLHPCDGVRWFEDCYKTFAENMGVDPDEKKVIRFDLTDEKFAKNYFDILHAPYEAEGVDFWWIDWQQGYSTKIKGLDPLWLLNHLHYKHAVENGTPLILSRYCGAGAQRYPLGFSGDTVMAWKFLDYEPYFTANASNVGYTWWSHDIGGHHFGKKDKELAVRWVQFGVFSPINRLHSTWLSVLGKEPWRYPAGECEILCKQLKLRHKLVPYIHTYNHLTHEKGKALIEPLYYTYPEQKWAYKSFNQYFFGGEMLVCPITKKGENGIGTVKANLPHGRYYDLFTRRVYDVKGEVKTLDLHRDLGTIPVLVKNNSIIPLSEDKGNGCFNPENMRVIVFGENASFVMLEDDDKNARLETEFKACKTGENVTLTVKTSGEKRVAPAVRNIVFEFASVWKGGVVSVKENGKEKQFEVTGNGCLKVKCEYKGGKLEIEVKPEITADRATEEPLEYLKEQTLSVVEREEGANMPKEALYRELLEAKTTEEFFDILNKTDVLREISKKQVREIYDALV